MAHIGAAMQTGLTVTYLISFPCSISGRNSLPFVGFVWFRFPRLRRVHTSIHNTYTLSLIGLAVTLFLDLSLSAHCRAVELSLAVSGAYLSY